MNIYTKIATYALLAVVGVPTIAAASSVTVSLVQGKTPTEAIEILAVQFDTLTGRVATLEDKQAQTDAELNALRAENENLRVKADAAFSASEEMKAGSAANSQCADLSAQLSVRMGTVQAPFESQIVALEQQLRSIKASGIKVSVTVDAETQALLDRLDRGEQMADFTPEQQDKVTSYQSQTIKAQAAAISEANTQKTEIENKIESINAEMESAVNASANIKALQDQLNALLCA